MEGKGTAEQIHDSNCITVIFPGEVTMEEVEVATAAAESGQSLMSPPLQHSWGIFRSTLSRVTLTQYSKL